MCDRNFHHRLYPDQVRTFYVKDMIIGAAKMGVTMAFYTAAVIGLLVLFGGGVY